MFCSVYIVFFVFNYVVCVHVVCVYVVCVHVVFVDVVQGKTGTMSADDEVFYFPSGSKYLCSSFFKRSQNCLKFSSHFNTKPRTKWFSCF